jgi:hypothetical protein
MAVFITSPEELNNHVNNIIANNEYLIADMESVNNLVDAMLMSKSNQINT